MKPLDDYLPYLLNRAGARIAASFTEVVRGYGITLPMWRVLAVLNEKNGQRMNELAQRTSIDASTLSRVVDGMEARGLARRARDGADARSIVVAGTPAGRELTTKIVPLAHYYEQVALRGFGEREARLLKRMLVRLYNNMDALDAESSERERKAG